MGMESCPKLRQQGNLDVKVAENPILGTRPYPEGAPPRPRAWWSSSRVSKSTTPPGCRVPNSLEFWDGPGIPQGKDVTSILRKKKLCPDRGRHLPRASQPWSNNTRTRIPGTWFCALSVK